jgi:hypothetical protein
LEIGGVRNSKYTVGENVRFTASAVSRPGAIGTYTVLRVLPLEGEEQHYRIKHSGETYERVARESQLDRAG